VEGIHVGVNGTGVGTSERVGTSLRLRLKQDDRIGFIDLYVVYKDTKTKDPFNLKIKEIEKNLRRLFYNQKHKELILFPYNMG
jgi:transcriptional regulator NrdR family protein